MASDSGVWNDGGAASRPPLPSFSLLVAQCPCEELLGRNVVYVHPSLYISMVGRDAEDEDADEGQHPDGGGGKGRRGMLIINGVAFAVDSHPDIASGTIGIDSMQRSTLCVSRNDLVQVRCVADGAPVDPATRIRFSILPEEAAGRGQHDVSYPSVDQAALAQVMKTVLRGQSFTVFQTAVVGYEGGKVCVQAFDVETQATDLGISMCMALHPRLGEKSPAAALTPQLLRKVVTPPPPAPTQTFVPISEKSKKGAIAVDSIHSPRKLKVWNPALAGHGPAPLPPGRPLVGHHGGHGDHMHLPRGRTCNFVWRSRERPTVAGRCEYPLYAVGRILRLPSNGTLLRKRNGDPQVDFSSDDEGRNSRFSESSDDGFGVLP